MPFKMNEALDVVKTRQTEKGVSSRITLMDQDLDLYDMIEFNTNSVEGTPIGSNFRSFHSHAPRPFADQLLSLLTSGDVLLNIPSQGIPEEERIRSAKAERFWAGSFEQANERLENALREPVIMQAAKQLTLRGTVCARVLIRNSENDGAFVDIKFFDPRHCVWDVSDEGIIWFCAVYERTIRQIRHEYPKANIQGSPDDIVTVYDFYDETNNMVFAESTNRIQTTLKKATKHGQDRNPVIVVPGGTYSGLKAGPYNKDPLPVGYGESIFAPVRLLYPILNEVMSIYLELIAKSRDQTYVLYSDSDVEIEENINEANGVLHLEARDRLSPVEVPETTKDAAQFIGLIQAMIQRGTLPQTAFGELAFQLSGFAITQLRQSLFSTMEPNLRALGVFYRKICMALSDQLKGKAVNPLELSGQDRNRQFFFETFDAPDMENIPAPRVKVVPQLPQDDQQRVALANALRQSSGPQQPPLMPDRMILDQILEVPDAARVQEMVNEQMAQRAHPAAVAVFMAKAAQEMGRDDLVQIYLQEVQKSLAPPGGPPGGPGLPGGPGEPPALPPGVLPPQMQALLAAGAGGGPTTQGPQVPPGAPRPGA